MLRRSVRLQEGGYYREEGTPSVSYKETLYKVFRTRRRRDRNPNRKVSMELDHIQTCIPADRQTPYEEQTRTDRGETSFKMTVLIMSSVLLLLLAFGMAQISELQKEAQSLRASLAQMGELQKEMQTLRASLAQMTELQKEVHSLRAQINMTTPLADTMLNFALKSQGAKVCQSLSSHTYWPRHHIIGMIWDKLFYWWYSIRAQQGVIQGHSKLLPGQCWPFAGERGHLFVSLSHPIYITNVTLGHIAKSQSPHGDIESAPRNFSISGMKTATEAGSHLGRFVYDRDGGAFQTFDLPNPDREIFRYVRLEVENNWGNMDHTCIYSFRVHGKLPT